MSLPKDIRIGGMDYAVYQVENLNDGDKLLGGQIDNLNHIIRIAYKAKDKQGEAQTLWHEIIHGICYHFMLDDSDESMIEKIAKGIYMVLKDNPELNNVI